MIEHIFFINGIYDVLCSLCILRLIKLPYLEKLHLNLFKEYGKNFERILGTWVLTYGLVRLSSNDKLISLSYLIEALYLLSEILHNNVFIYKGLFVVITCIILSYLSYKN